MYWQRRPHLVLLKLVFDNCKSACAQHVALHKLVAGLKVAAQPNAHKCQVLACREEVPSLQIAWRLNLSHHWQACSSHGEWLSYELLPALMGLQYCLHCKQNLMLTVRRDSQMRTMTSDFSKLDSHSRLAKQDQRERTQLPEAEPHELDLQLALLAAQAPRHHAPAGCDLRSSEDMNSHSHLVGNSVKGPEVTALTEHALYGKL